MEKHTRYFWIKNPKTGKDNYYVNFNGCLVRLETHYDHISVNYNDILGIITKKTKEEKFSECQRIFNEKHPQRDKEKKSLSKEEQSRLEKIFQTRKTL